MRTSACIYLFIIIFLEQRCLRHDSHLIALISPQSWNSWALDLTDTQTQTPCSRRNLPALIKHVPNSHHCWLPSRGFPTVNSVTSSFFFFFFFVSIFSLGKDWRRRREKCNPGIQLLRCFFSFCCLSQFCLSPSLGTFGVMGGIVKQQYVCRLFTLNVSLAHVIQTRLFSWCSWQGGINHRCHLLALALFRVRFSEMGHFHWHWCEPHRGSLASHQRQLVFPGNFN